MRSWAASAASWLRKHGRRALITGLAGGVALLIAKLAHIELGFWAVVTAVIVIETSIGGSLRAARIRLTGTAIGALSGAIFAVLLGADPLSVGIGIAVTVLVCSLVGLSDRSIRLAAATTAIVMVIPAATEFEAGWLRFLDTVIGVGVALVISFLVWPIRARTGLRGEVAQMFGKYAIFVKAVSDDFLRSAPPSPEVKEIRAQFRAGVERHMLMLKDAMHEPGERELDDTIVLAERRFRRYLVAMSGIAADASDENDSYPAILSPAVSLLAKEVAAMFEQLAETVQMYGRKRPRVDLSRLRSAMAALDEQQLELRERRTAREYELEQVIRGFSFIYDLTNLAQEQIALAGELEIELAAAE